ncbi:putative Quercetin 2,3-dioxygenase [Nitrospira sp. KM1]|uniref:pirin family protein n=1 Tax=Nitrospira sp. KM1 TaxID=1936990 RepID=UPI0013A71148|nr:pirin family protein [Nitrospira sp. KM1]BCA55246.1 putative Quercetin 2,3-dioxygenase [Nitrospira sp. KM1]
MTTHTIAEKSVHGVYQPGSSHMVGDGFPVRNLFPSNDLDRQLSPFLMLDYAGPHYFSPTDQPRGVGEHPHRGFETVTIVYEGVVAHRDSAGNAGTIGPGDVQWMTAASGVVHEEFHEKEFARKGGTLHAIQLWVNLPQRFKMSAPAYQTIVDAQIPVVDVGGGAGRLRIIAGAYEGRTGPAHTMTPVELFDLEIGSGRDLTLTLPEGHQAGIFVLSGRVTSNRSHEAGEAELIVFDRVGSAVTIHAKENSRLLIMAGEPIEEPIARYGPFVMNTRAELQQAARDYQSGKMGHLS